MDYFHGNSENCIITGCASRGALVPERIRADRMDMQSIGGGGGE